MDWVHLHLALNHIPVLGPPFLIVFLIWSALRRERGTLRFCLLLFALVSAASIAIKFTGDFAAEKVANDPSYDRSFIERHEEMADQATTGMFLLGAAAVAALIVSRQKRPVPAWSVVLVALLAITTLALMTRTANSGGHIRHPEIRPP
jgi:hypothetical protein